MPQVLTPTELQWLAKAQRYCAREEQCLWSVRQKLFSWGVPIDATDKILDALVDSDFINEQRYVRIFCESKLRYQKWGRRKVAYQLSSKHIPNALVKEGLAQVSDEQYLDILSALASHKWAALPTGDPRNKERLAAYLLSRGYEMEYVRKVCISLMSDNNPDD